MPTPRHANRRLGIRPCRCLPQISWHLWGVETKLSYIGNTMDGKHVFLIEGGGFSQSLIEWENFQPCVCVHTWQLESFISGKMASPCIHQHIHRLASILNIFIEHVISGRGRYLTLLHLAKGKLETLWEESRTIPTCLNCLASIVTLRDLVLTACRDPRPRFHYNQPNKFV